MGNHESGSNLPRELELQKNWKLADAGESCSSTYEFPFYSDASFVGEVTDGFGPYRLLNTVPGDSTPGSVRAPIVLRVSYHSREPELLPPDHGTDESIYHGGHLPDEVAALLSLAAGTRVRAGNYNRYFDPAEDPLGRPAAHLESKQPSGFRYRSNRFLMLPEAVGRHEIDVIDFLSRVRDIEPGACVALVRAARMYQEALWAAETDPNSAWVLLASAIESAANYDNPSGLEACERLKRSLPDLHGDLLTAGGNELVEVVAGHLADLLGATGKFIKFVLNYKPKPPAARPENEKYQVDWKNSSLKKVLSTVYAYRSRHLHAGLPFPAPMLSPPSTVRSTESTAYEMPFVGLGGQSHRAKWLPEDLPIALHTFHHLVRGALLNWWLELPHE